MSYTDEPPVETRRSGVPSARAEQPGPEPAPAPTATTPPPPHTPLDIDELRHPSENSRLALALVAASAVVSVAVFVLISLGRVTEILAALVAIGIAFLALWFGLQLWRVRLLADGVQVSAETLPQVQEVMDVVLARLDYRRRVDLFVVDKVRGVLKPDAAPISLTTFFGVRVIVAEGGALGDLDNEREREQLVFLFATCVGALKARHTRWSPYLLALERSGLPKLVFLFVYPWYRATTYTGDRIAYACCGDLDVSLEAVYRVLVGKETAPHLRAAGLVQQALVVRRQFILRLSQLLRRVPHATNRYLDLLSFAEAHDAAAFENFRASLGDAPADVDGVFARLRRRRPSAVAVPIAVGLAACMLVAGVIAGVKLPDSPLAHGIDSAAGDGNSNIIVGPATVVGGSQSLTESPSPEVSAQAPATGLLAHVPADLRATCTKEKPVKSLGEYAALQCNASDSSGPSSVFYVAYYSTAMMKTEFDADAAAFPRKPCTSGNSRKSWHRVGSAGGPIGCFTNPGGHDVLVWGDNDSAILAYAYDPHLRIDDVYAWWTTHPVLSN